MLKAELFKEAATPLESEPLSLCWDRREPDSDAAPARRAGDSGASADPLLLGAVVSG